jgi:hypothetical protein
MEKRTLLLACFVLTMAAFDKDLVAHTWPVGMWCATWTLPKLPVPTTGPNLKSWKLQFSNHTCHPSPQQISWIIITSSIYSFDGRYFKKIHRDFSTYVYICVYICIYIRVEVQQKLYANFTSYMLLRILGIACKLMTTCYLPTIIMSIFSCSLWCLKTGCPNLWTKQFGEHGFWTLHTWSL